MSARPLSGPRGRLVGLAVVAVAVAGLFAMHGLSAHGAAHPSPAEAVGVHSDHGADLPGGVPADHGDDMLLSLCFALLVVGIVGLAMRGRPGMRWVRRDANPPLLVTTRWTARRDRDPPDLHALSIRRC